MKRALLVLIPLILIAAAVVYSKPKHSDKPGPVVLELFTSQGCSSCPPADRLLSKLGSEDTRVIPLAYHVDYWNYLGWRDPFSSAQWSNRQRLYAQTMQSSQVYTPQLVINGTDQLVGSSESNVRAEIERQLDRGNRGTVSIEEMTRNGNELTVKLHAQLDHGNADLVVALFENGITTAVKNGENANRNLTNDFIVRWESRAAEVRGAANASVTIPIANEWQHLGVAAFLQDPKTLQIYGSAVKR